MRSLDLAPRRPLLLVLIMGALAPLLDASGAPVLRFQAEQRGDFKIFGNTVGFDCRPGTPDPIGITIDRVACRKDPNNAADPTVLDSAIDVLWSADDPAPGQVSLVKDKGRARSTAVLVLPPGATITYARLYWAAGLDGTPDQNRSRKAGTTSLIARAQVFEQKVSAESTTYRPSGTLGPGTIYQSTADVTRLLQAYGPGPYRVGGIESTEIAERELQVTLMAWSIVVFYRDLAEQPRNLTIFDGLDAVALGEPARATLRGFVVPMQAGFDAKLGVIAYEGDFDSDGDSISVNGTFLSNAQNPERNFFNATRTYLGEAMSAAGDLPRMSGTAGSMHGFDIDVVDVKALVKGGDVEATLSAETQIVDVNQPSVDNYFLGAFITSVSTFKPLFDDFKVTLADLTQPGSFQRGHLVEITIEAGNTGNDDATGVVLEFPLPNGLTYEPGTIQIVSGDNAGQKTDLFGDDQAEFFPGSRTLRLRLGQGADARQGGVIPPSGDRVVIRFRARIDERAGGKIVSQAMIETLGAAAAMRNHSLPDGQKIPAYRFFATDGTPAGTPATIVIDECDAAAECAARPAGTACVEGRFCGCQSDMECEGAICDRATAQCPLPRADLKVVVEVSGSPPMGLDPVRYTVKVQNLGPGSAPDQRVFFTLPAGASVERIDAGAGWQCSRQELQVVCTRAVPLPSGQQAPEIIVSVSPSPDPSAHIVIDIGSGGAGDPSVANNIFIGPLDGSGVFRAAGGGFGCSIGAEHLSRGTALGMLLGFLLLARLVRRRIE